MPVRYFYPYEPLENLDAIALAEGGKSGSLVPLFYLT